MSAYFVTATSTDIGKTFVTSGLIRSLRAAGGKAGALKPVVSGFDIAPAAASDPGVLLEALGEPVTPETVSRISLWRFAAPLSPDMAAARENKRIDFDALVAFCRKAIAAETGTLFIEGVGGVMVPIDERHTVLDWARALGLPLIVVTGTYLGTISHTLTAMDVIARAGLKIAALIVNESVESPVPTVETVTTLARFLPETKIEALPRAHDDFANLAALF